MNSLAQIYEEIARSPIERRLFVAMNLDVYHFSDPREMESVLLNIAAAFPNQRDLCASMITSRKKLENKSHDMSEQDTQ